MSIKSNEQQTPSVVAYKLRSLNPWLPSSAVEHTLHKRKRVLQRFRFSKNGFWEGLSLVKTGLIEGVRVMKSMAFRATICAILEGRWCDSQFPLGGEAKTLSTLFTWLRLWFFMRYLRIFLLKKTPLYDSPAQYLGQKKWFSARKKKHSCRHIDITFCRSWVGPLWRVLSSAG